MAISSNATGLRPGVCTSTTRPTTPYTGQLIYETDTGYLRVWDGSAWDYLSAKQDVVPFYVTSGSSSGEASTVNISTKPWNMPWGIVGTPVTITSSQGSITAVTDITGASITFTAVANRRYKANWQGLMNSTVAGDGFNVFMTDSSNAIQQQCIFYLGTVNDYSFHAEYVFSLGAGSVTRKLRSQRQYGSGTGTLVAGGSYSTQFWIEDIGPS